MVLFEEHVGGLIGQETAAGCAAYAAYLLNHGGDPAALLHALGAHHFKSFKLVSEIAFVAAALMTPTSDPVVPDCSEALGKCTISGGCLDATAAHCFSWPDGPEFDGLVAAVHARHDGAVGAFIAELRRKHVPDVIRTAVLDPDHAQRERLDKLMIELAGALILSAVQTVTIWMANSV